MTTRVDANARTSKETNKNDWDQNDEDDNWDDWGDAEEDFPIEAEESKDTNSNNNASDKLATVAATTTTTIKDKNFNRSSITEQQKQTTDITPTTNKSSWGSLWGAVISTASDLTSTVSHGLNQVIGVPDPEELARINTAEAAMKDEETLKTNDDNQELSKTTQSNPAPVFGLNLVSGVTTLGTKVLNTGLDTLEGIGKKTMNILQENDPLLMNKRKMLGLEPDRPNLSEMLKEAKDDADQMEDTLKKLNIEKSKQMLRFEILFESNCGLVHLEALEILSKESKLKMQKLIDSVSGNALSELQETINEVKELMELEDLEAESEGDYDANELNERLTSALEDADLKINFDDIVNIWSLALQWLATTALDTNESIVSEHEIFVKGITALAETSALEMNKLHKIAELLLVKEHHSTANEVDCIVQLCKQFNTHLHGLTNRFAASLAAKKTDESKTHSGTLFAEMLLAMQQIEKAFNLFLPILQIGAV